MTAGPIGVGPSKYGWICPSCDKHWVSVIRTPELCSKCGFERVPAKKRRENAARRQKRLDDMLTKRCRTLSDANSSVNLGVVGQTEPVGRAGR